MAPGDTDPVPSPQDASIEDVLAASIRRRGSLPFDEVVELALYHPTHGFYSGGGAAGRRRGDFITSPEVGPLFGAVLANAFDVWWTDLGRPDPFVVVECGAGVGTLARTVLAAGPACLPALTYVLVERSATLRARHGDHLPLTDPALAIPPAPQDSDEPPRSNEADASGPRFTSLANLPAHAITGIVIANELLDNVPFRMVERTADGWDEVRVGWDEGRSRLHELVEPPPDDIGVVAGRFAPLAAEGSRIPIQAAAVEWLREAIDRVDRGRVVVFDYATTTDALARTPPDTWLRTYREHARGQEALTELGTQDITVDVCVDQLARVRVPTNDRSQTEFLRAYGMGELVEEGKRIWRDRGHIGDLEAIRGRSRVVEAEALSDDEGLGAFRVLEWEVDRQSRS